MKRIVLVLVVVQQINGALLRTDAGLVVSGMDTLRIRMQTATTLGQSFDFILGRPCISGPEENDPQCKGHIGFNWVGGPGGYVLLTHGYRRITLGKINFDSVKAAPPDSEMENSQYVFSLQPDSLKAAVGNVYALRTVTDPRAEIPLRAKIKILGFKVIDSAKHEVEMRFLWACNMIGQSDLRTSGLDTFDLGTPTVASMSPLAYRMRSMAMPRAKVVFSRDGKGTPAVLVQPGGGRAVWVDLRGRDLKAGAVQGPR